MNKTGMKAVLLLLSMLMIFTMFPDVKLRADEDPCGFFDKNEGLIWTLRSDDTLEITLFNGEQKVDPNRDYHDFASDIKNLIIYDAPSAYHFDGSSFTGFSELTSINIDVSVNDPIDSFFLSGFQGFEDLEEIHINGSVNGIESYAFEGCPNLTAFSVNGDVGDIHAFAFSECGSLKSFVAENISGIEANAFNGTSLEIFVANVDIIYFEPVNENEFFNDDWSKLARLANPGAIRILGSLNGISDSAFVGCTNLVEVQAESIGYIGNNAFSGCKILTEFICGNIETIEEGAFEGCSNLTSFSVNGHVGSINAFAFGGCESLKSFVAENITYIEANAFNGTSLDKFVGNVEIIHFEPVNENEFSGDDWSNFARLANPGVIQISGSLKGISDSAFHGCTNLVEVQADSIGYIGDYAFSDCEKLAEFNCGNIGTIGYQAFQGCKELSKFSCSSVGTIGGQAFWCCEKLAEFNCGSIETIGEYAFDGCPLLEITASEGIENVKPGAFNCCGLSVLGYLDLTDDDTFICCGRLESIKIPDNVTNIGSNTFCECYNLQSVYVSSNTIIAEDAFLKIGHKVELHFYNMISFSVGEHGKISGKIRNYETNEVKFKVEPDENYCIDKIMMVTETGKQEELKPTGGYYLVDTTEEEVSVTVSFKLCQKEIKFCSEDGKETYQSGLVDVTTYPIYHSDTPVKESDKEYTYTFVGWKDNNGQYGLNDTLPVVREDNTFYAVFSGTENEYEIRFLDEDGNVLQSDMLKYGSIPEFRGERPVKINTDQCTYIFAGWAVENETDVLDEFPEVTGKADYHPVFSYTTNSYEISFVDENGEKLQSDRLEYGETPVFKGTEPSKAEDDKYVYIFAGWTPEITEVTGEATYSPVFTPIEKKAAFEAFVERMYVVVLDRPSEPEGKTYWTDKVLSGELTGADCARNFLNGQEFKDRNLSDEEFVTVLYKAFFDRDAKDDPDGFNFWMESLKVTGRENIIEGFISSPEWIDLCSEYCVKPGTAKAVTGSAADFATRLYTECLGREPDEEGLKFWSQGLTDHKITGSQAAHEFFYSAEFNSLNLGNKELITRMYKTFLGRDPEDEGLTFWMDSMDKGMTKDQLFDSFVNSKEFSEICVSYAIDR